MKVKIFTPNRDGKIEFNQKDLESLLNEIYEEGYNDGKKNNSGELNYPAGVKKIEDNNPFRWDYDSLTFPSNWTTSNPSDWTESTIATSNITNIDNRISSDYIFLDKSADTISIEYAKY